MNFVKISDMKIETFFLDRNWVNFQTFHVSSEIIENCTNKM